MKKILLIILALTGLTAKAQYFHHIYGTTDGEKLSSGINTNALGLGHFLVGHNGQNGLAVSRTDVTGNVTGAPYFDGWYTLFSPITGSQVFVEESEAFEMDNGGGFGIVGKFQDLSLGAPNTGIFYMQLTPAGGVSNIFTYVPSGVTTVIDIFNVGGVAESVLSSGKDIYITGSAYGGSNVFAYAMKLDMTSGGIRWSWIYDIQLASGAGSAYAYSRDIIESPYTPNGVDEAVLVGQLYDPTGGSLPDAFSLRVDASTGIPVTGAADIYGTTSSTDEINSISIANATAGGSDGFILGGASDVNGSEDFWLVKTDQTLGSLWASLHDYNGNGGTENVCNDVIERLNTGGKYEYYAAGYVRNGLMGGTYDMVVVKTNDMGVSTGMGQFTYGDKFTDYGIAIDQYNGTGADGISVFGFREAYSSPVINGNYDMYLVKAYFNGETPCNQKIVDAINASGPGLMTSVSANLVDRLVPLTLFNWGQTTANDLNICFATSLGAGSNARVAPAEPKGDKQAVVAPNPMQTGAQTIAVSVEVESATTAQLAIYDMLGRQYYTGSVTLTKGSNTLPIDISKSNMSAGTYTLRITMNGENKSVLLLVE
ncbi:MAG: T9SS type A sorting domain-containing protein [Bacteroidetes bacterium]|nr:MAG: T9SS type A sorting domain-containing protein [Bacteroidota bacterium]